MQAAKWGAGDAVLYDPTHVLPLPMILMNTESAGCVGERDLISLREDPDKKVNIHAMALRDSPRAEGLRNQTSFFVSLDRPRTYLDGDDPEIDRLYVGWFVAAGCEMNLAVQSTRFPDVLTLATVRRNMALERERMQT